MKKYLNWMNMKSYN